MVWKKKIICPWWIHTKAGKLTVGYRTPGSCISFVSSTEKEANTCAYMNIFAFSTHFKILNLNFTASFCKFCHSKSSSDSLQSSGPCGNMLTVGLGGFRSHF